ncbi:DMT family transporter [Roseovarius albus]|uniref:DMT family transporter n=1 Tax=Roseovarius albus TaxID=1247867 RepID=UPI000A26B33A|nr:DMT family transporter [Roseovarius albus]
MTLSVVAIILFAALLHATWNAIVKSSADRTVTLGMIALAQCVAGGIMAVFLPLPSYESFLYILFSTGTHFCYYYMLNWAYRYGDSSVVYPIARGIVPALVAIWAMILVGELLPLAAWFGIALIAAAIPLSSWKALTSGFDRNALMFALGTGLCISIYSVFDGIGVRLSGNTLSYWAWGAFLHIIIAGFIGIRRRHMLATISTQTWVIGLAGGLVSMVAYGLVLYAKNFAPLGAVSALRETSVIFAAVIGFVIFKEGNWKRRSAAAVLMSAGVAVIALTA